MTVKTATPVLLLCATLSIAGTASAACIRVPEANLRSGPATSYGKTWEVFKYMPLKQIGQKDKWTQVLDLDGDSHWVFSKLLTEDFQCAVVKVGKANVRSGPGTSSALSPLSPVEKYYSFKVLSTQGDWVKVRDEVFNDGWMAKSLLWMP